MRSWILALLLLAGALLAWRQCRAPDPAASGGSAKTATAQDESRSVKGSGSVGGQAARVASGRRSPTPEPREDRVAGLVLGPGGQPQAGVTVTLFRVLTPWPELQTKKLEAVATGFDGRFAFSTPLGPSLLIEARKPGLAKTVLDVPHLGRLVTLRMHHGFPVKGFVVNAFHRAISNCEVLLEPGPWSDRRAIAVRTDDRGRFGFEDVPPGVVRVTARHPAFSPATLPTVNVGPDEELQIQFRRRRLTVAGRVVMAGAPDRGVSGAAVRGFPSAWNRRLYLPFVTHTDEDGKFVLEGLGAGNLVLEVSHAEFSTQGRTVVISRSTSPQRFELVGRSRVDGRLLGANVHEGVRLQLVQAGERVVETTVDAHRRFAFHQKISAGAATLVILDAELCFAKTSTPSMTVAIEESPETSLELRVARASTVLGVVRDEAGRALAGVRIMQRDLRSGPLAPTPVIAVTDQEGRYTLRGLSPSWALLPTTGTRFLFQADGFAVHEQEILGPEPGRTVRLDPVVLQRPGSIEGVVTRASRPLAGVLVRAVQGIAVVSEEATDASGSFTFHDLAPGSYRIKARYSTLAPLVSGESFQVRAGATVGPVLLSLETGRTIEGVVIDGQGNPVSGALVLVLGQGATGTRADAAGRFSIEVPPREVRLRAYDSVEMTVQQDLVVPLDREGDVLQIVLPRVPRGSISARVLGLRDRRPVTSGIIRVRSLETESKDEVRNRQRNIPARRIEMPGGELLLEDFPAGRSRLTVQCDGYGPFVKEIELQEGGTLDLGQVRLDPGARLRGIVTDPAGKPIAGARVHLGSELDLMLYPATSAYLTDREGRFSILGVTTESRQLVVRAAGFAPRTVGLRIPEDLLRPDPLPISVRRGARIEVRVVDGRDQPVDQAIVVLQKRGRPIRSAFTEKQGRTVFGELSPGRYEVSVIGLEAEARRVEIGAESGPLPVFVLKAHGGGH